MSKQGGSSRHEFTQEGPVGHDLRACPYDDAISGPQSFDKISYLLRRMLQISVDDDKEGRVASMHGINDTGGDAFDRFLCSIDQCDVLVFTAGGLDDFASLIC